LLKAELIANDVGNVGRGGGSMSALEVVQETARHVRQRVVVFAAATVNRG